MLDITYSGADPWIANIDKDFALSYAERRYACPSTMLLRKFMVCDMSHITHDT